MEKDRKYKKIGLVAVIVAVIGLSIAFAALSRTLTINGTGRVAASNWEVVWQEINGETFNTHGTDATTESGYPKLDGTTIAANNDHVEEGLTLSLGEVSLKKPNDYATYKINIKNKGDIDAVLQSINIPDLTQTEVGNTGHYVSEFITIEILNGSGTASITTPQSLASNASIPVVVKVSYNDISNALYNIVSSTGVTVSNFNITFTVNQDDGNSVSPEPEEASYSFTLNQVSQLQGFEASGGTMYFEDASAFWNLVGANVSQNPSYTGVIEDEEEIYLHMQSNSNVIGAGSPDDSNDENYTYMLSINAVNVEEDNQPISIVELNILTWELDKGEYSWVPYNLGEDNNLTFQEFLELYGNVTFTFVPVS